MTPYYQDEAVMLYRGDCREVLPTLEVGSTSLVLTDPPYGTEDLGGGYGRRQVWDPEGRKGRTIQGDGDLTLLAETWPLCRRLVSVGWAVFFCGDPKTPQVCEIFGDSWFGQVIWDKLAPGLGYHIRYAHESIAVLRLGEPSRPPEPLLSVLRATVCPERHPHEKPLTVVARLLAWGSSPGDLVVDPFAGVGTSLVAAKMLGRRAIGIEIDEKYCRIAVERFRQAPLFVAAPPSPTQLAITEAQ